MTEERWNRQYQFFVSKDTWDQRRSGAHWMAAAVDGVGERMMRALDAADANAEQLVRTYNKKT